MVFQLVLRILTVVQKLTDLVFFQLPTHMDKWWERKGQGYIDTWWNKKDDTASMDSSIQLLEQMFVPIVIHYGVFRTTSEGEHHAGVLVGRRLHHLDPEITFELDDTTYSIGDEGTIVCEQSPDSVFYLVPVQKEVTKDEPVVITSRGNKKESIFKLPLTSQVFTAMHS
jgi:hypothetical protein